MNHQPIVVFGPMIPRLLSESGMSTGAVFGYPKIKKVVAALHLRGKDTSIKLVPLHERIIYPPDSIVKLMNQICTFL